MRNKVKGVLSHRCKDCHSKYRRQHYLDNKQKYITKAKVGKKRRRKIILGFFRFIKTSNGCIDCGEKDPIILEFDHLRDKSFNLGEALRDWTSVENINAEIEKCVVRCCNCHRKKTIGYKYKKPSNILISSMRKMGLNVDWRDLRDRI